LHPAVLFCKLFALRTLGTRRSQSAKPPCRIQKILRRPEKLKKTTKENDL